MKKILKNKKGFTLVELIVVIAILGVLAVIMVPAFTGYVAKAKNASIVSNAKSYCTAYQAAYAEAQGDSTEITRILSEELKATSPTQAELDSAGYKIEIGTTGSCSVVAK